MTVGIFKVSPQTYIAIAIVVFAVVIRLYALDTVPLGLYYDEITSTYYPFLYSHGEMPLNELSVFVDLLAGKFFIYGLTGPSAFWSRFPSVLYGVLFVVICWRLANRLYGKAAGIIACFLAAVVPWSFHFSRYGVTISISYAFYVSLAVYLLLVYVQTEKDRFRWASFLAIAASFYTHAMALIFGFLFFPLLLMLGLAFNRAKLDRTIIEGLLFGTALLFVASPFIISYLSPATQFDFTKYITPQQSVGLTKFIDKIIQRGSLHLSPDFLILSGGRSFVSATGSFSERITLDGLYYYATAGNVGMLNAYGIFVYVGFLWFAYNIAKTRRISFKASLLLWWIASYAIASGFASYDNPNPARNIVGLPAFILLISLVVSKIWARMTELNRRHLVKSNIRGLHVGNALKVVFLLSLVIPSVFYFRNYFAVYGSSYNYFDYDYKILSDYLTRGRLWSNMIIINEARQDKWYGKTVLSFYNDSARNNIVMGDLSTALSFIGSEKSTVIYVTRDVTNQSSPSLFVSSAHSDTVSYPNGVPVFLVWKLSGLNEEPIMDDDLKDQWAIIHGTASGERGIPVIGNDDTVAQSGSNSLKISLASGYWDWSGIQHDFDPSANWSDAKAISFQWYGSASNISVQLIIACNGGEYYSTFADDFQGWREFVILFSGMQYNGLPLLNEVNSLAFVFWGSGEMIVYLDRIALLKANNN